MPGKCVIVCLNPRGFRSYQHTADLIAFAGGPYGVVLDDDIVGDPVYIKAIRFEAWSAVVLYRVAAECFAMPGVFLVFLTEVHTMATVFI